MNFRRQKGTQDFYGEKLQRLQKVLATFSRVATRYGYEEIKTPIFEDVNLFKHGVGQGSDIVIKEMFTFFDKAGREVALRPEGTAPIIRAVIENNLINDQVLPARYFYSGTMYRYERPQEGRFREFYQFGVENFGDDSTHGIVELIIFAKDMLNSLAINGYKLHINYLGNKDTQRGYVEVLTRYFKEHERELSDISVARLSKNPLRILDSKEPEDEAIIARAPRIENFLSDEETMIFNDIQRLLLKFGVDFKIDGRLVRGLDYYSGLIFEFIDTTNVLGSQSTIIGGGTYANLVETLGGRPTNGYGFGIGVERILKLLEDNLNFTHIKNPLPRVVIIPISEVAKEVGFRTAVKVAKLGTVVSKGIYNINKIDKAFRVAEQQNFDYLIIIGDQDLAENVVTIRDVKEKTDKKIDVLNVETHFKNIQ